jgi:hypothetical protein
VSLYVIVDRVEDLQDASVTFAHIHTRVAFTRTAAERGIESP